MPTASTVSKSTTATKPVRKTRTRKARTTKPTVKTVTVAKVSTPKTSSKSQIRTLKTVKRPSASKLITPQRYWSDIKTRWAIHNYEITMLVSDFSKVVTFVTPYHTQLVKQVKAWTV